MIPKKRGERTADDEAALLALSDAYHSTLSYYAQPESSRRNEASEIALADKWCRVGTLLWKYDKRLANRLDLKSRYWREGATWTDEAIREAKIGLEDVWRETNVRLRPS